MKLFLLLLLPFGLYASPLKIGMELSYPPFEMVCNDGEPCGVSVDLAKAFGKSIEREVAIENIPFIGLIPSLKNGTIDIIISSLTVTNERKRAIAFSDPYATTGLCLLINSDSPINNITQVNKKGVVVVVKSGTSGELYAMKNLDKATVRILDKESTCVLEVIQGKADVFIYDQLSVYTNWKKNPDTTKANLEPFQKEFWAFGVKKESKLLPQINKFLKKFREEGGFDELADKWLLEQKTAFKKWGVPFVF